LQLVRAPLAGTRFDPHGRPRTCARKNLIKRGDEHLRYEIREIVEIANEIVKRAARR
jgi:hypothetical protein